MKRITSMTRTRYIELLEQWFDGTLEERWKDKEPETRKEKVEERQIRAIAMAFDNLDSSSLKILNTKKWSEFHLLDDNGIIRMQLIE